MAENCPTCGASKEHWLKGAIKHPGLLGREAKASGRSKFEQATHDAQSSNPHVAARGRLGQRLVKKAI